MEHILGHLRQRDGIGTGTLYRSTHEVCGSLDRDTFEELLAAMTRAGLLSVDADSFTKGGEEIRFQRARLLGGGRRGGYDLSRLLLSEAVVTSPAPRRRRRRSKGKGKRRAIEVDALDENPPPPDLVEQLRQFRLEESRRRKVPAYIVFSNKVMMAMASRLPTTEEELLAVHGVGPDLLRRSGAEILGILRQHVAASDES